MSCFFSFSLFSVVEVPVVEVEVSVDVVEFVDEDVVSAVCYQEFLLPSWVVGWSVSLAVAGESAAE